MCFDQLQKTIIIHSVYLLIILVSYQTAIVVSGVVLSQNVTVVKAEKHCIFDSFVKLLWTLEPGLLSVSEQ